MILIPLLRGVVEKFGVSTGRGIKVSCKKR